MKRLNASRQSAYYYCPSCPLEGQLALWHLAFDTPNCRQLFSICRQYFLQSISGREAAILLKECDLNDLSRFSYPIQKQLLSLLDYL